MGIIRWCVLALFSSVVAVMLMGAAVRSDVNEVFQFVQKFHLPR
jgi:hypothetical protein